MFFKIFICGAVLAVAQCSQLGHSGYLPSSGYNALNYGTGYNAASYHASPLALNAQLGYASPLAHAAYSNPHIHGTSLAHGGLLGSSPLAAPLAATASLNRHASRTGPLVHATSQSNVVSLSYADGVSRTQGNPLSHSASLTNPASLAYANPLVHRNSLAHGGSLVPSSLASPLTHATSLNHPANLPHGGHIGARAGPLVHATSQANVVSLSYANAAPRAHINPLVQSTPLMNAASLQYGNSLLHRASLAHAGPLTSSALASPLAHAGPLTSSALASPLAHANSLNYPASLTHGAPLSRAGPLVHATSQSNTVSLSQASSTFSGRYDGRYGTEGYSYPKYEYSYSVDDPNTGDKKAQHESRDGDVVMGKYSLLQPDGSFREVSYSADDLNGFNAIVQNSGPSHHVYSASLSSLKNQRI